MSGTGEPPRRPPPSLPPNAERQIAKHQQHQQHPAVEDRGAAVARWARNGALYGPFVSVVGLFAWKGLKEPLGGMFLLWGLAGTAWGNYAMSLLPPEERDDDGGRET